MIRSSDKLSKICYVSQAILQEHSYLLFFSPLLVFIAVLVSFINIFLLYMCVKLTMQTVLY